MSHDPNLNNGLITKIWGKSGWIFGHSITFGYPIQPTNEQMEQYRCYFNSMGDVLPCKYCRDSYKKFISSGVTELTNNDLKDRNSLTNWFYRVHNAVNDKLGVNYGVTYDEVVDRYESFRAICHDSKKEKGCVVPLDYKAYSYRSAAASDPPLVEYRISKQFIEFAKIKGLDEKYFTFIKFAEYLGGNTETIKNQTAWGMRNSFCQKQIHYMQISGAKSVDDDGVPTINELILIVHMSSNLCGTTLSDSLIKINDFLKKGVSNMNMRETNLREYMPELWIDEPWLRYIQTGSIKVVGQKGNYDKFKNWIGKTVIFKSNVRQIPVRVTNIVHHNNLLEYIDSEGINNIAPHLKTKEDIIKVHNIFWNDLSIEKAGGMVGIHIDLI
jgi:ASC-1-like (ASCH) protein